MKPAVQADTARHVPKACLESRVLFEEDTAAACRAFRFADPPCD